MPHLNLDLDGCLAGFHQGAFKLYGREKDYHTHKWSGEEDQADMAKVLGVTRESFVDKIHADPFFFANLPAIPEWEKIVEVVKWFCPDFNLCTSPGPWLHSPSGKLQWIKRFMPWYDVERVIFVDKKYKLGYDSSQVLIDDWEKQVNQFSSKHKPDADGKRPKGLLLPRPWNKNHKHHRNPAAWLVDQLEMVYLKSYEGPRV